MSNELFICFEVFHWLDPRKKLTDGDQMEHLAQYRDISQCALLNYHGTALQGHKVHQYKEE